MAQASLTVQALPSSQGRLSGWALSEQRPVSGSQVLTRQSVFPVWSQVTTEPAFTWHTKFTHTRVPLQALPSSTQSESTVQLQAPGWPAHSPPLHWSLVVQASPSSQGAVLFVWVQPSAGSQTSSVHGSASSQAVLSAVCVMMPLGSVQASSVQLMLSSVGSGDPGVQAPEAASQPSVPLQAFPSLHWGAVPAQVPAPSQTSPWVQATPSSQTTPPVVFFMAQIPVAGSQVLVTHALSADGSQKVAEPETGTQVPPTQS